jgi:nucleoside-diphosphate-sugar epimerase
MSEKLQVVCGSGPLGRAVTGVLRDAGERVRVVTRSGRATVPDGVESVAADVGDPADARRAFADAAMVYHCASPPYERWATLVRPLMEGVIAGAAEAGAKVVYGDNMYSYGPVDRPLVEDLPYRPVGPHAQARADAATRLMAAHDAGTVQAAIGRASDFFGPGVLFSAMGDKVFPAALAGTPARLLPRADTPHTYTFIDDFARALVTLGSHERAFGQVWHVPSPEARTTRGLVEIAFAQTGHPCKIQVLPKPVIRVGGMVNATLRALGERLYQTERPFVVDHAKYEAAFGADPTPTDEAVKATLAWYRSRARA